LHIYVIDKSGDLKITLLGNDLSERQTFQYIVPANCWFASRPAPGSDYCFVGCTVAPGFEFEDLELANAKNLSAIYPQHTDLIHELCR